MIPPVSSQNTYGFHWGYFPDLLFPLSSSGCRFKTVSCVPSLRLSGIMPGIKGHAATGCFALWNDDVIRLRETPGDNTSFYRRENFSRSQRLACCWCAIHIAPRQSCQHGAWLPGDRERLPQLHESKKLSDETLLSPHRLQMKWEANSGVPGVVSVMQCGNGVSAMARSFLLVCRNPGAPVIICGAAARIRLNYRRSGSSAAIGGGLEGEKQSTCLVFILSSFLCISPLLPFSLNVADTHTHTLQGLLLGAMRLDHAWHT